MCVPGVELRAWGAHVRLFDEGAGRCNRALTSTDFRARAREGERATLIIHGDRDIYGEDLRGRKVSPVLTAL